MPPINLRLKACLSPASQVTNLKSLAGAEALLVPGFPNCPVRSMLQNLSYTFGLLACCSSFAVAERTPCAPMLVGAVGKEKGERPVLIFQLNKRIVAPDELLILTFSLLPNI